MLLVYDQSFGFQIMNLHEYQSKKLFFDHGIPVLEGNIASSPDEAKSSAEKLKGDIWVVKAQVHAGGRGKAVE